MRGLLIGKDGSIEEIDFDFKTMIADSDDAARLFRYDRARCSGMIPPT